MSHEAFPTDRPAVVTCGLPYANGDLHVGHMRTYVSGDVMTRSLRRLGQETAFVSGSDMHGTPVAVNAWEEGVEPETYALRWHEKYAETFPRLNVEFDNYGHTHDETNTELTREIVTALDEAGYVDEREIMVAWDPEADQALPARYVEGTCPYCGAKARGDECDEGCQRHLEPGEIEDPRSVVTGNPAEYVERSHRFFRLSDLQDYLAAFIDRLEGTSNARNQPLEWIEGELQDWCITRDMDWGIDYPGEGAEDLVLYVWVDAPIEYISSTRQYSERVGLDAYDWEAAWKLSEGQEPGGADTGEIVHVIGRDIIQHHTVFWPSMLHVAGYNEPRAIMASGFVNLDGRAFSTSRNRAIWVDDYLDAGFHPDLLRYYLVTVGGFQDDIDFSWDRFAERVNGELVGNLGNFAYRALLFAERNWDGTPDSGLSADVEERIEEALDAFRAAINDYSPRRAANAGVDLAHFGNQYIQRNEPWKLVDEDPDAAAQVIRDCVQIAKAVCVLLSPTLPGKMDDLWSQLGEVGSVHDVELDAALATPPAEFGEPGELFEGVEEERVEALNAELEARIEAATADGTDDDTSGSDDDGTDEDTMDDDTDTPDDLEPLADERISFDDFQALDVRVGEIREAEPIEGADKLVRLQVDVGAETRQVVAGLRQLHDVEALPGTRVVVLVNLEKAELFGVESNGMVLAAGEEADLLTTHGDAPPGTKIR